METAIVVNEAEFLEFVHEEIHPRSRGADHFRECFLGYPGEKFLRLILLSVAGKQQKSAREPFLSRVEELVDQVLLHSNVP